MYIREWQLAAVPFPHWNVSHSSGWVPYQADYPWTLMSNSGVHFVGVWVADAAHNVSELEHGGLDFASLVLPDATVEHRHAVPHLVYYPAGVTVTAQITAAVSNRHPAFCLVGTRRSPLKFVTQLMLTVAMRPG